MKKLTCIFLTVLVLTAFAATGASATGAPTGAFEGYAEKPDWIITEINPDQTVNNVGGYSDTRDPMEFYELYNNSGKELNLYDYGITYNGADRTNDWFETAFTDFTAFKGPDWRDKTYQNTEGADFCGVENMPKNPAECKVKPGEVVVVWSMFKRALVTEWNNGKGLTIEDFREFWNIPADVKVVCLDGNSKSSDAVTGHCKNFNIKNSKVGTYGISLITPDIERVANGEEDKEYYAVNYPECPELCYWISLDFNRQTTNEVNSNNSHNFLYDPKGLGGAEWGLVKDTRRGLLGETNVEATAGRLTAMQKLCLGIPVDAGEKILLESVYVPESEKSDEEFLGFMINGKLHKPDYDAQNPEPFVFEKDGIYTLEYLYGKQGSELTPETTLAETTPAETTPETTPEATPGTTSATTPAPVTTPAPEEPKKSGCGSYAAFGLIALFIPAAVMLRRKKR